MKGNKKGCLIVVVVIVLLILAVPGWWYFQYLRTVGRGKALMLAYLEQKYNQKFVIDDAHYIWATKGYSFTVHPEGDPNSSFPAFIDNIYQKTGMGDMYGLVRIGRESKQFIKPLVDAITKNCYYSANFDSSPNLDWDTEAEPISYDIRKNRLTPIQAVKKYPDKICFNVKIFYALNINDENKEEVFKKIYNLLEFLKDRKFSPIEIEIEFYPPELFGDKTIKQVYDEDSGWFSVRYDWSYIMQLKAKNIFEIANYKDLEKHLRKFKSYDDIIKNSKKEKDNGGRK